MKYKEKTRDAVLDYDLFDTLWSATTTFLISNDLTLTRGRLKFIGHFSSPRARSFLMNFGPSSLDWLASARLMVAIPSPS